MKDEIEVVHPGNDGKPPKTKKAYVIRVDKQEFAYEAQFITGREVLQLVGKSDAEWHLQLKKGGHRERIEPDQKVDLDQKGIERFETVQKDVNNG